MWQVRCYGSGTTNVEDMDSHAGESPWLYVVVVYPIDGDRSRQRYEMCQDLCRFLNGGPRPAWLDDMERVSEYELSAVDGSSVQACGPMFDADPPNLNWQTRQDDDAKNARARLIDRLWLCPVG